MKTLTGLFVPATGFSSPVKPSFYKFLFLSFLIVSASYHVVAAGEKPRIVPSNVAGADVTRAAVAGSGDAASVVAASNFAAARMAKAKITRIRLANAVRVAAKKAEWKMIVLEAACMSEELQLADSGLNEKVLEYALLGYHRLLKKGLLQNTDVLTVCDFSQSSSLKRMYVIDVANRKLLYRNYVAHGIGSGAEYANDFSNVPESHKSSLGFYITRDTYYGGNGLSLRIDGMDRGFNSLASQRNIVIHGAPYVSERILHKYGVMGTTFGCPAIPEELTNKIIPAIKGGSCLFIYYPSERYLMRSTVLNG